MLRKELGGILTLSEGQMPETVTIPGREEFALIARLSVRRVLADAPTDVRRDAELIVDEFTANAVLWSRSGYGGKIDIIVDREDGASTARVEVVDDGSLSDSEKDAVRAAREHDDDDQFQRGLMLVAALAKEWGQRSKGGRGIYWAVLAWD